MVRKYKEKNRARRASKLSEEMLANVLMAYTMGLDPTYIASEMPVSVQTVRNLFSDFRGRLGAADSYYYVSAFYILEQHWPKPTFFETLRTLRKMGLGLRFRKNEIGLTYDCIFSCPASLPPKRLKKAYDAEVGLERPNLINPNPIKGSADSETHDRMSCRSCPNRWLRENTSARFLDLVAIQLAYYRGVKRDEFGPYFMAASLSVMLDQFQEVHYDVSIEKNIDPKSAMKSADEHFGHVVNVISKLAFEVLSGRKLEWRDLKDEERPSYRGLF